MPAAYVEMGIPAKMAFDPARNHGIRLINTGHLFEPGTMRIALRLKVCLRGYVYVFIEFPPHLKRGFVETTVPGNPEEFGSANETASTPTAG